MDRVAVYGLGGVGLGICAVWIRAGCKVIGVDVDENKVKKINQSIIEHPDGLVVETVLEAIKKNSFYSTTDGVKASELSKVKIIAVPLFTSENKPDFTAIDDATTKIAKGLKKGDIVIVETSLPPGTTMNRIKPMLESVSMLRADEDFFLAHSPERVMVEHVVRDIEESYPKIVGGVGPKSTEIVAELYSKIAKKGVIKVTSATTAEFEKLIEGVYRDVNIALANELADLARALGIDFEEARIAANSQPFSHVHKPGPGVGGICIPVYPYLLMWAAKNLGVKLELTSSARKINEKRPKEVVKLVEKVTTRLGGNAPIIAVLGAAFRGGTSDVRNSPSLEIAKKLTKKGYRVRVFDPHVEPSILQGLGFKAASNFEEVFTGADVVIIATDHPEFKKLDFHNIKKLSGKDKMAVVDSRNLIEYKNLPPNMIYVGIGKPWIET